MINEQSLENPEQINQNTVVKNTSYYLENYLNPDKKWGNEITPKQRIYRLKYAHVNWEVVSSHIREMEYHNFLQTPYWKAIATHIKYKAGYRCQVCNSGYNLVTHHRDYGIHGLEHAHMHELIALCGRCHNKFHDTANKFHYINKKIPTTIWNPMMVIFITLLSMFFIYICIEGVVNEPKPQTKTKKMTAWHK